MLLLGSDEAFEEWGLRESLKQEGDLVGEPSVSGGMPLKRTGSFIFLSLPPGQEASKSPPP